MSQYRVSMDIGGTFTDIIVYDESRGSYTSAKVPSTPADPADGVLNGVGEVVGALSDISFTVHGTTVGLNAFLQRRGERVLLLATEGASDVYQIARGTRTRLYDIHFRKPEPLVPRCDIVPVGGRLNYLGEEIAPIDLEAVKVAAEEAKSQGIRSLAVAFLFSYVNPDHELAAEQAIRSVYPEANVSLSHRVAREWREYERTSSAVFDAYIAPVVDRYLERLEGAMRTGGLSVPLHVMQSNGGVLTAATARQRPIQTLLSGPAGGTMGGVALAQYIGRRNMLCVDMGGTSFDISLVVDGQPDVAQETDLEGLPLLMPIINIHTIGAGGGSIGYAEAGGLRVGPESAGADPGPACYGRGGTRPTVTDANLVVGRIDPDTFLGGRMTLDVQAANAAVASLAQQLGLEPIALAEGILDVVNAKMAQAIRTITVEQGIEPRDFSIVAFGGAGPMHAVFLAQELEIREVIVPPFPGAFSAWGMLQTKLRHDFSRAYYRSLDDIDPAALAEELSALADEGTAALREEGIAEEAMESFFVAEMRYVGQEYTVNVPLVLGELNDEGLRAAVEARFGDAHELRYGHANRGAPIEFVVLRVAALGELGRAKPATLPEIPLDDGAYRRSNVTFGGTSYEVPFVRREDIGAGAALDGPVVIEEATATTVVPPQATVRVDQFGSLVITLEEA
jgi:N-methylhydantoinase A